MKRTIFALLTLLTFNSFSQENLTEQTRPIVEEGKRLYQSEMASWYGTDLFVEAYKDMANVGGYFSYADHGVPTCIFFSKAENPKVLGTITFDSTYNTRTAKTN